MRARELLGACFVVFAALLVWPLLSIPNRPALVRGDCIVDVERFLGPESGRPDVDLSLPFRAAKARVVEEFERAYISGVLEASGGKLTAAAKHADMDAKNFAEKLVRYGLRKSSGIDSADDATPG